MATLKKSARKTASSSSANDTLQAQAERLSKNLGESAQQVWLAGVGAFGRAQAEGTKLFETLVKEGLSLEQTTRKLAGGRAQVVRDAVENTVGQARERASDTWDRLEKVFEERVQRALRRLEVPNRDDLSSLIDRVDELNAQLRNLGGTPSRRATAGTPPRRSARATQAARPAKPAKAAKSTTRTTKAAKAAKPRAASKATKAGTATPARKTPRRGNRATPAS